MHDKCSCDNSACSCVGSRIPRTRRNGTKKVLGSAGNQKPANRPLHASDPPRFESIGTLRVSEFLALHLVANEILLLLFRYYFYIPASKLNPPHLSSSSSFLFQIKTIL